MTSRARAYESLWARVDKPGRYLGNERGMVRKDPARVALRFALAFPDVYEIAQSHPGLQLLYDILNRRPDVYADRVYAPWFDMEIKGHLRILLFGEHKRLYQPLRVFPELIFPYESENQKIFRHSREVSPSTTEFVFCGERLEFLSFKKCRPVIIDFRKAWLEQLVTELAVDHRIIEEADWPLTASSRIMDTSANAETIRFKMRTTGERFTSKTAIFFLTLQAVKRDFGVFCFFERPAAFWDY